MRDYADRKSTLLSLREGGGVMGLFLRMILFLFVIGLLFWGTAEYALSISDAVLSTLLNIQEKDFQQEWPDIFFLILILAIPFFIFYFIYHFFIKAMMKYGETKEGKVEKYSGER